MPTPLSAFGDAALDGFPIPSICRPGEGHDKGDVLWDRLTRFLGDARIPLDNNAKERGISGPVVGRKNQYGSKSRRGTEIAAVSTRFSKPRSS